MEGRTRSLRLAEIKRQRGLTASGSEAFSALCVGVGTCVDAAIITRFSQQRGRHSVPPESGWPCETCHRSLEEHPGQTTWTDSHEVCRPQRAASHRVSDARLSQESNCHVLMGAAPHIVHRSHVEGRETSPSSWPQQVVNTSVGPCLRVPTSTHQLQPAWTSDQARLNAFVPSDPRNLNTCTLSGKSNAGVSRCSSIRSSAASLVRAALVVLTKLA
jgi:hypothetical protein